jgi:cobalt-zinc-cadmium efflux system outer membrane protein
MKLSTIYPLLFGMWLIPAAAAPLGSDVASLLNYASEHNPELAAMRHEADAAAQREQPAGALPDPVLRAELMDITNRGTNRGASLLPSQVGSTRYRLMQSVPWFGKRDLKREVAEAGADQAQGRTATTWAELSAQIKSAYAQYYYVSGSQKITRELLDLLVQMEKVAQVRYANGLAAQQDAVRAQVEQTVMKTELVALDNTRRQIEAQLNALLSRPVPLPLAVPERLRSIPAAASLETIRHWRIAFVNTIRICLWTRQASARQKKIVLLFTKTAIRILQWVFLRPSSARRCASGT